MSPLVARTRPVDAEVDVLDVVGEDGLVWSTERLTLGGHGCALRIALDRSDRAGTVAEALQRIEVDDEVGVRGTGPIALGALPFDTTADGALIVPEVLHGRDRDGHRWVTTVTPDGADATSIARSAGPGPRTYRLHPDIGDDEWCALIARARDELRDGEARKVVLARTVTVEADRPLSRLAVLRRLRRAYPDCTAFATPELVGASPELLVARDGLVVRSHPMAGTVGRSPDPAIDAQLAAGLLASAKDRIEHQITIDRVIETLLPFCSYLDAEPEPSVTTLVNLHHLSSLVEGRLARPPASVLELVTALHPTPAVCGEPRAAARRLIDRYESFDRGCYAGPVGWVDGSGNGEWVVGIRSAEIIGARARLFAGVGVVDDSDPRAELEETRLKLEPMLNALVRP